MGLIKNYLTHSASTLGLATQLKIKHRVSGLEIRVNFMAKLEGCMSLNTPWRAIYDTRTKDLLTDCNNYGDLEHVSGAVRFHLLRLFSPGRLASPAFCQDHPSQSVRIPPPSARTAPVLDEGGLRFVMSKLWRARNAAISGTAELVRSETSRGKLRTQVLLNVGSREKGNLCVCCGERACKRHITKIDHFNHF